MLYFYKDTGTESLYNIIQVNVNSNSAAEIGVRLKIII